MDEEVNKEYIYYESSKGNFRVGLSYGYEFNDENIDVLEYRKLPTAECLKELLKFNGVGPKVADCIALFGMQKYDTFPVDVWVKRVMQEFYVDEDLSLTKIRKFGIEKFGDLAGFAQQYLFYYAREFGIGR